LEVRHFEHLGADELAASEIMVNRYSLPLIPVRLTRKGMAEFLKGGGRLVLFAKAACHARAP